MITVITAKESISESKSINIRLTPKDYNLPFPGRD